MYYTECRSDPWLMRKWNNDQHLFFTFKKSLEPRNGTCNYFILLAMSVSELSDYDVTQRFFGEHVNLFLWVRSPCPHFQLSGQINM